MIQALRLFESPIRVVAAACLHGSQTDPTRCPIDGAGAAPAVHGRPLPGSVTVARNPPSAQFPRAMSPPWPRTMLRAIARPKPLPPVSRLRDAEQPPSTGPVRMLVHCGFGLAPDVGPPHAREPRLTCLRAGMPALRHWPARPGFSGRSSCADGPHCNPFATPHTWIVQLPGSGTKKHPGTPPGMTH